ESLGVSLAAQAATLPLVLFHFGRLSLISPVANLVIAPLVAPAMLVAVIALFGGLLALVGLPAFMLAPFTLAGWLVLAPMVSIADVLARVPLASVPLPPPFDFVTALVTGALVLAAAIIRSRGDRATPGPAPLLAVRRRSRPKAPRRRLALLAG